MSALFRKCKPAVDRYWLMLLAGALWTIVGIGLCMTACSWFAEMGWSRIALGVIGGFGAGVLVYRFGFSRLAEGNIRRISAQPLQTCVFAFQAWRSYALILGMMALGVLLRHSALSRMALGMIYAAIGTGLTLSSSVYYEAVFGPGDRG